MDNSFLVPRAPYRVIQKGDRLYDTLLKFVVAVDTVMVAVIATQDPQAAMQTARVFAFKIRDEDPEFEIDTQHPTMLVLKDLEPDELVFRYSRAPQEDTFKNEAEKKIDKSAVQMEAPRLVLYMRFVVETTASLFMTFFASYDEWLLANVSTDRNRWPELLRFANRIRNAVAHRGAISWDNPNPTIQPVEWHGFRYSHSDNRRHIIGSEIHLAALIVLMFELSDELDHLGAPQLT